MEESAPGTSLDRGRRSGYDLSMARPEDVAAYVLERLKSATTYELQKLIYYANGWSMAWDGERLVEGTFGAWKKGPVLTELWPMHARRHRLVAGELSGDSVRLTSDQRATLDAVLEFYGSLGAESLVELSHRESPWREARGSAGPTEKSDGTLDEDVVREYFVSLARGSREKRIPDAVRAGVRLALSIPEDEIDTLDDMADSIAGTEAETWLSDICRS